MDLRQQPVQPMAKGMHLGKLMKAIIAHDGQVKTIDSSIVRVHQQAVAQAADAYIGRSRGGLTAKLHLRVIGNGLPVQIDLSPGQMTDQPMAKILLNDLPAGADVIANKGCDPDWITDLIEAQDCTPHFRENQIATMA